MLADARAALLRVGGTQSSAVVKLTQSYDCGRADCEDAVAAAQSAIRQQGGKVAARESDAIVGAPISTPFDERVRPGQISDHLYTVQYQYYDTADKRWKDDYVTIRSREPLSSQEVIDDARKVVAEAGGPDSDSPELLQIPAGDGGIFSVTGHYTRG
jgi:hypothetical protein